MNRKYRVTVSEDLMTLGNYFKRIEIGYFDIKAKNATEALEKALELAKHCKISNPVVTDIVCLDKVFILNG